MNHSRLEEIAEYYETHDTSAEMEAAQAASSTEDGQRMSGYSVRLPAAVLQDARHLAQARGLTTGAYLRELIEAGIARAKSAELAVPVDVLLAAVERYQHRKAS